METAATLKPVYGHVAVQYRCRPTYPQDLFTFLAESTPERQVAWDCGCGSGQASHDLAEHFDLVVATDPSEQQILQARAASRVEFRCAPAEASGLPTRSVNLVGAFMAAHWFNLYEFYSEARRVARPGAVIALFVYGEPTTGLNKIDDYLTRFSHAVSTYGGPSIQRMRNMYSDLHFPFEEIPNVPKLNVEADLGLSEFICYTRSRASVIDYMNRSDVNLVRDLQNSLEQHWPKSEPLKVNWQLRGRVGKLS